MSVSLCAYFVCACVCARKRLLCLAHSYTLIGVACVTLLSDKAKVIYAPPEVYLPFGQPAVLDCHFRANPPLKNLRWEKDGLLFDSYNVPVSNFSTNILKNNYYFIYNNIQK